MDSVGTEKTPEEKREERFEKWLAPPGIEFDSPEAERLYYERLKRLTDAYRLREPDRVPVSLPISNYPAYYAGVNLKTIMYDYDELRRVWKKYLDDFEMDTYTPPSMVPPGKVYDLLDYRGYHFPGRGLPDNAPGYQFVEDEYMMANEYDKLIKNPSDFWMRTYMPRIFGLFEPLKSLQSLTDIWEIPAMYFMPFISPDLQNTLRSIIDIGEELGKWIQVVGQCNLEAMKAGVPSGFSGSLAKAPFDMIGDTLRGTRGIMLDLHRQPDKLLEAIEVITDLSIDSTISTMNASGGVLVIFVLHKGADGFLSNAQFDKFYWPSLRRFILALIDEGIVPVLFAEGSYNDRIERCNEFPKGAVSWMFDRTDMATAKKVLGDKCSISGNVSTSLLTTGTPEEVKEYCRKLIEVCAPGGGYILAGGATIDTGEPENLRAMMEASKEYGVYK